ncbi:RimK family alpha-L-glutamate ligase [Salipaludibacillus sp. LMS25]|jgi:RimK family alpha-L-glutamate ligase|uniref:ATP-grasp domain-containing protein n=1 Tax=Salipaludibacillus sp. LMS25 TaxID=2924031 RepID=UPI0020D0964B|nr:RimK family alpha-L-glutamate ligase [Salipaludibacillus sp. LMS25]UTR15474.1 RimK family alpha-L-glutamate ligase [Salipaludibacillus sp. LMS25]
MAELNGWIVFNGHLKTAKFQEYVDWFVDSCEKQQVTIKRIGNDELLVMTGEKGMTLCGNKSRYSKPDFIHFADKDLHLARQLEQQGIRLFNRSSAIHICDNKSVMHGILNDQHLPMAKTIIAPMIYSGMSLQMMDYLRIVEEKLGLPLIVKEAYGSFGEQVYWVETRAELEEMAHRLAGIDHLYQQPIFNSLGTDLRLNVIGESVVAAMKRSSQSDFRANVTAGGTTQPYRPTKTECQLAIAAAKAVGADFAGVDLLIGEDGPIICEVNSNPHLRSIYDCTSINVADHMIDYIKHIVTTH